MTGQARMKVVERTPRGLAMLGWCDDLGEDAKAAGFAWLAELPRMTVYVPRETSAAMTRPISRVMVNVREVIWPGGAREWVVIADKGMALAKLLPCWREAPASSRVDPMLDPLRRRDAEPHMLAAGDIVGS